MSAPAGFLIVRAGPQRVGLPVEHLVAVVDAGTPFAVPSPDPAVRGVIRVRDELLPLVHLASFLAGAAVPAGAGDAAVIVRVGDRRFCLGVDEAELVVRGRTLPVPDDAALPWAAAVAAHEDGYLPLLDLSALGARLAGARPMENAT